MAVLTDVEVKQAYELLKGAVNHTPLQYDHYLSKKYQATILLKREDLQKVRSFKLRGAYYAIKKLPAEKLRKGVVCASAGNHAQGVAYTCRELETNAAIFMPTTTPQQKVSQVRYFGGEFVEIHLVGDTFDAAAAAAKAYCLKQQRTFIAPFNDLDIIAGQGTLALEFMNDATNQGYQPDYVVAAVGGGGLISGIGAYVKNASPATQLIGIEPKGANSMQAAFAAKQPVALPQIDKFVDGAAVQEVGNLTYQHSRQYVDEVVAVDEGLVCSTILELYGKQAIVAEPAGALSVAALAPMAEKIKGKTVVCVISGGNNDINRMEEIEERSLVYEGVKYYFVVNFPQRPGALKEFVSEVLAEGDDITHFEYTKKNSRGTGPAVIGILLKHHKTLPTLKKRLQQFDANYVDLSQNKTLYDLVV